jgi:ABC-type nitrate/sulfonate/bicarbonate transport system substrate-binding protein
VTTSTTGLRRRSVKAAITGAILVGSLALAACGSSSSGSSSAGLPSPTTAPDPHHPEKTSITGTMYENAISAQYFLAKPAAQTYGLTLNSTWETDGGAGLSQLVAGDIDLLQAAPARIADAALQGVGVAIVAGNYESGPNFVTLEALPKSGITSPKDLAGKKVGLPSTVGIQANRLRKVLSDDGVDPNSVTFVQVPFGDAPAQLEKGTIDAVGAQGAVLQQLRDAGSKPVFDFGDGEFKGRVENVWAVTTKFLQQNPNTVAAFQCAIVKGGVQANVRANVESYFKNDLGWDAQTIKDTASVNSVTGPITTDQVQADFDDLVKLGIEPKPFDMSTIMVPQPTNC